MKLLAAFTWGVGASAKPRATLRSGANPLRHQYFLPKNTVWGNEPASFTEAHAKLNNVVPAETCSTFNGVLRCYEELGRTLWMDEPTATEYVVTWCTMLFCQSYANTWTSTTRALPIDAINRFQIFDFLYNPAVNATTCKRTAMSYTKHWYFLKKPWFSYIKLRVSYRIRETGKAAKTKIDDFLIQLPRGNCDRINTD